MRYRETIDFLFNSLPVFEHKGVGAYKPGLERVGEFAASLGDPQDKFLSIHVAGTNGKGSTSHLLASVLQSAGYRTGLYTSPHLLDFRERIRIDGEKIPEQAVVEFTELHKDRLIETGMTFFEMATVMAFDWFAGQQVDIAIIETGLGGRLDATNIITPLVSVITNIGLEHTQYLGNTIPLIASEKGGIIKPGIPVVIGETDPESAPIFVSKAKEFSCPILFADNEYTVSRSQPWRATNKNGSERLFTSPLGGDYQHKNVATVLTVIDFLQQSGRFKIDYNDIHLGLMDVVRLTELFGRWQVMSEDPLVVCDTAHNAHGIAEVARQITEQKHDKLYMVLGFVADKNLDAIIPLLPQNAHYILTQPSVGRAMPIEELRIRFAAYGIVGESVVSVIKAVRKAIKLASKEDMIYIGGSNFTVAEALPLFLK